jgi:type VI secretion system protein ImpH
MATAHGRKAASIIDTLLKTPARFSFGQAMRLLMLELEASGVSREEAMRRVRITPWLSLAYPPSEITALTAPVEDPAAGETDHSRSHSGYTLETPLIGLYGTEGPLPTFYTEELLDEARIDQSIVKDFLDIINNRLGHYLYRAELHYNHPRRLIEHADTDLELILFSLMGQAYPDLRPTERPHPQAAERLMGPRTALGLADYLAFELGWPHVEVEECVPRQAKIPESQRCRLGVRNSTLATSLFVGEEIPDVNGKIRIHLKDLPEARLRNYLHGNPGHARLQRLVRAYLDETLVFDLVLHPAPRMPLSPKTRTLGGGLTVGCHLPPRDMPPVRAVTVHAVLT